MKYYIISSILLFTSLSFGSEKDEPEYNNQKFITDVQVTLENGIKYFHSINMHGGYVYAYTLDLNERWHDDGHGDKHTIEIQPPGTPTVGSSFLRA